MQVLTYEQGTRLGKGWCWRQGARAPPQKQTYPITQIDTHTRRAAENGAAGRLPTALSAEHAELATRELCLLDECRLHLPGHAEVLAEIADDPATVGRCDGIAGK